MNVNLEVDGRCGSASPPSDPSAIFQDLDRGTYPFCTLQEVLDELSALEGWMPRYSVGEAL